MDCHQALVEIIKEYERATLINGAFNSAHEGYAVILEELDELWEHVKKRIEDRNDEEMRREAIQVGAMALRFLVDIC